MSQIENFVEKFRFAFEIAILLILALYVTVQARDLRGTTPDLKSISLASATSTVPGLLNYQGYLTDNSGAPLDGAYAMKFAIYDAPTDGTELWAETQLAVEVIDGQLSALLGESVPISSTLFATYPDTFIGVTVGSDPEMMPRQRIHSVPYAMHANDGVPDGTVIQYYPPLGSGDPCPSGYMLADGNNGTPDLSGLFLRAAGTFPEGGSGTVGDNDSPTHRHNVHIHGTTGESSSNTSRDRGNAHETAYEWHTHNVDFWNWSEDAYAIPPYFVVTFCIKQ